MTSTITRTLADYAAARGLSEPCIGNVFVDGTWTSHPYVSGQPATIGMAAMLNRDGYTRVEITFAEGGRSADFAVSELIPLTGIAAHADVVEL